LEKNFSNLHLPANLADGITKTFGKLNSEIQNFEAMAGKSFTNMGEVNKAQSSFSKILTLYEQLKI
jgi:hypothetical protein